MNLTVITHSGPLIGGGHLSRCLTLADCLKSNEIHIKWILNEIAADFLKVKGFDTTVFATPFDDESIDAFDNSECFIVDSYEPGKEFYAGLRGKGQLIVIDDYRNRPVEQYADILLNYNLGAEKLPYEKRKDQLFLLGPLYSLIRKEYWNLEPSKGYYCLFVAGSSDIKNTSEEIAKMWRQDWPLLIIVLGSLVSAEQTRNVRSISSTKSNVKVLSSPENFPELIAEAGLVICTSSVTSYEALSLRKPVAVFQVAENQIAIGNEIEKQKLGVNLGYWGLWGKDELSELLSKPLWEPPDVINPHGSELVVERILNWLERRSYS